jgi:hypothetical protein
MITIYIIYSIYHNYYVCFRRIYAPGPVLRKRFAPKCTLRLDRRGRLPSSPPTALDFHRSICPRRSLTRRIVPPPVIVRFTYE